MKSTMTLLIAGILFTSTSLAQTASSLSNRGQEKQNWCWAANSEMILDWSGTDTSQADIADFAVAGADVGNYLDSGKGGWGPFRIPGTRLVFFRKGMKQVLEHFGGIRSQVKPSALSLDEARSYLDDEKPFVIRQDWEPRGAHVLVAKDHAGSIIQIEDPWPADFQPRPGNPGISASVDYDSLTGTQPDYRAIVFGVSGGNRWTKTLTLGKALDIVFLIDSTSSMTSYIDNVKAQARHLVNSIESSLQDPHMPVMLQAIHVGGSASAGADFSALASASGGQKVSTFFASDVSDLISGIIDDVANGRFPVGSTATARPTFSWESAGGGLASSPEVSQLWVDVQRFNPRRGWRNYKRMRVKDPTAGSLDSPRNLPVGTYRWRLKGTTRRQSFEYPDGSTAQHEKLGKFVEEAFTEFERVENVPGDIEKFTETCPYSPDRRFTVLFEDDPVAEKFAIRTGTTTATRLDDG